MTGSSAASHRRQDPIYVDIPAEGHNWRTQAKHATVANETERTAR